ncbi:hypothetical protein DL96DRAFT_1581193 [Flagelloscypha sp. PMI_526]|nr:hypothetical protein DL96DRAFT_1581193 [Flagelloscypha sp. PMI_526]
MKALPQELIYQALPTSSDNDTLRSCSLVSRAFRPTAQSVLFSHICIGGSLDGTLAICDFFLAEENGRFLRYIQKLTLTFNGLQVQSSETPPVELVSLLIKLGPQINALYIEGLLEDEWGDEVPTLWPNLSPVFRDCLYNHVMPFLTVLELSGVTLIRLFTILRHCPMLQHLVIEPFGDIEVPDLVGETSDPFAPDGLSSLSLDRFTEDEFDEHSILGRFLQCSGGCIKFFELVYHLETPFSPSLQFLSGFQDFTRHIKHLSLGKDLFNAIVFNERRDDLLSLHMFPQLEKISFDITLEPLNDIWFDWVFDCFKLSTSFPEANPFLKMVHFTIQATSGEARAHKLDSLAHNPALSFSLGFTVPVKEGNATIDSYFHLLRSFWFPSWDQAGRLKLFVKY